MHGLYLCASSRVYWLQHTAQVMHPTYSYPACADALSMHNTQQRADLLRSALRTCVVIMHALHLPAERVRPSGSGRVVSGTIFALLLYIIRATHNMHTSHCPQAKGLGWFGQAAASLPTSQTRHTPCTAVLFCTECSSEAIRRRGVGVRVGEPGQGGTIYAYICYT